MKRISTALSAESFLERFQVSEPQQNRLGFFSHSEPPFKCGSALFPRWDDLRKACERKDKPLKGCECCNAAPQHYEGTRG